MGDLAQGLTGRFPQALAWIVASALFIVAADIFLVPTATFLGLVAQIQSLDATTTGVTLSVVVVIFGLALNAAETPLYRFLEGYGWPGLLRRLALRRQLATWTQIRDDLDSIDPGEGFKAAFLYERLSRYPFHNILIAPTQLANAFRRMETFGFERYGLDSAFFLDGAQDPRS